MNAQFASENLSASFSTSSCSFYSSWYNLKKDWEISIYDDQGNARIEKNLSGHYTPKTIGGDLKRAFEAHLITHRVRSWLKIYGLARQRLKAPTFINRSFNDYIINCDLLTKDENLFNSNPSMVLGCFDVSGGPFERVKYSPLDPVMRRMASRNYTSAMRIFVTASSISMVIHWGLK